MQLHPPSSTLLLVSTAPGEASDIFAVDLGGEASAGFGAVSRFRSDLPILSFTADAAEGEDGGADVALFCVHNTTVQTHTLPPLRSHAIRRRRPPAGAAAAAAAPPPLAAVPTPPSPSAALLASIR